MFELYQRQTLDNLFNNEHSALSKHSRDKSSLSGSNHLVYKFVSECRVSDKALLPCESKLERFVMPIVGKKNEVTSG